LQLKLRISVKNSFGSGDQRFSERRHYTLNCDSRLQNFARLALLSLQGNGHPPTSEIFRGLLTVDPDVGKPLLVVALCEVGLGFVFFDVYNDVAEVGEDEDLL
jgi:hypothetical protein